MTVRGRLKAAVEQGVLRSGIASLARRRRRHDTLILAYHDIAPDGAAPAGDRSLHLPRAAFAAQLDVLRETHDVVPLATALEAMLAARPQVRATTRGRPLAVVTFDDACRGAVSVGVAELAKRKLPATIFVAPAFVPDGAFWWDELSDPARGLDPRVRARALDELGGRDADVRAWARGAGIPEHRAAPHMRCASEEELRAAVATGAITLGAHTWSHPNLTRLAGAALADELARPLAWLRERFDAVVPYIAYPYGLASATVAAAARDAGYRGGLLVTGGWIRTAPADAFALPRLNIPAGLSRDGFALRAAGLFCE